MSYNHVFINHKDEEGKEHSDIYYDLSEQQVREWIARPYMENKRFWFLGQIVHPSRIKKFAIFWSYKKFGELILPNGKSALDEEFEYVSYCFWNGLVEGTGEYTQKFITSPPEEKEEPKTPKLSTDLMKSATFLGLDTNWSLATCALQLQEVAMTLVAKRKNIELDKTNVEKVLNKKIEELSFNDQYEAFSRRVMALFNIEMPILTTHLRKMRAKVLHEGYNPKPEETEPMVSFTIGLLRKLKDIS